MSERQLKPNPSSASNSIAGPRTIASTGLVVGVLALTVGCSQNPYLAVPGGGAWQAQTAPVNSAQSRQPLNPQDSRLAELNRRVQLMADDNRQLQIDMAQVEQQRQVYEKQAKVFKDELELVRKQLASTAQQLESTTLAAKQAQSQVRGMQASTQVRGGTSITPNTNLSQLASRLNLGLPVRQDGDKVRISIPSDQLFQPGTAQLTANSARILDPVAAQIRNLFTRQRIGIEGYTDAGQLAGGASAAGHQLASAQASRCWT